MNIRSRTLGASNNPAVIKAMASKNNGRYNGLGREWETPPELFVDLDREFHFSLDPCATPLNAKCVRYFTEADNGLAQSWAGERVFMNPPYGREVSAWTRKAREESSAGALVVGLVPASTDLAWWHQDVVATGAEVRYLRGRVRFLIGGPYRASGFFASVIVIWRPGRELNASERGYVAGLIDGEGCISFWQNSSGRGRWTVTVSSTSSAVIDWLIARLGGRLQVMATRLGSRQRYEWRLNGAAAVALCGQIESALVIKQRQARLFAESYEGARHGRRVTDRAQRQRWHDEFRRLNRRGA